MQEKRHDRVVEMRLCFFLGKVGDYNVSFVETRMCRSTFYMFKKAFWVPYEDSANYPTLAKTMEAISKYCEENGKSYTFINDDEVEINGKRYEIYRGYENGSRGNYGIKCKEK